MIIRAGSLSGWPATSKRWHATPRLHARLSPDRGTRRRVLRAAPRVGRGSPRWSLPPTDRRPRPGCSGVGLGLEIESAGDVAVHDVSNRRSGLHRVVGPSHDRARLSTHGVDETVGSSTRSACRSCGQEPGHRLRLGYFLVLVQVRDVVDEGRDDGCQEDAQDAQQGDDERDHDDHV